MTAAAKPKAKRASKKVVAVETQTGYKGFDRDLKCRGFQFAVGETYTHQGRVEACSSGFHVCQHPFDVWSYYPLDVLAGNRFCRIQYSGATDGHASDSKLAVETLYVETEVTLGEMIKAGVDYILANVDHTAAENGDQSAATNTGYRSAATNTGAWSAATNTGNQSAATNTGNQSAATNTGYRSAATNTGAWSAASVEGKNAVAVSIGYQSKAKASLGGGFVVAEHDSDWNLIALHAAMAGKDGIKADTFYRAENGKLVECGK